MADHEQSTHHAARANPEVIRALYEAFNAGDLDQALAHADRDVEFVELPVLPDAGVYRGPEGVRRFVAKLADAMDDVRYEIEDLEAAGDRVLVDLRFTGRGHDSGIEVDLRFFSVWTLRDGLIVRHEAFMDEGEARRAAGLDAESRG